MVEHFKSLSAIFPIILQKSNNDVNILLHRRKNTGYQDGKWDFAGSGHVDEDETAQMAVVRECAEELGIDVNKKDISFAHITHRVGRNGNRTYYDIYFLINLYHGTPKIMEPDKCSELQWFPIDNLPDDMIEIRKNAIINYLNNVSYSEIIIE